MPWDIVRLPCGSMSTHRTRWPSSAKAAARLSVVVVLATPPFWLANAMTLAFPSTVAPMLDCWKAVPVGIRMARVDSCMRNYDRRHGRRARCAATATALADRRWRRQAASDRARRRRAASARRRPRRRSALGLAMRGQKVAVVTIDPARRLASALGLDELSGEPHRIDGGTLPPGPRDRGRAVGDDARREARPSTRSSSASRPTRSRARRSSPTPSTASSRPRWPAPQELSAVAKLYELHEEHDFDVIVLDTPPSRNALDFLEAPGRLLGFLEGRALQVFLAPGGLTREAVRARHGARVLDLRPRHGRRHARRAVAVLPLAERASSTASASARGRSQELLRSPETAFLIVTSPEPEPVREAAVLGRSGWPRRACRRRS